MADPAANAPLRIPRTELGGHGQPKCRSILPAPPGDDLWELFDFQSSHNPW
jgi:hypothetical protein